MTGMHIQQKEHGTLPCPILPRTEAEVLHQIEGRWRRLNHNRFALPFADGSPCCTEAMSEAVIRKCLSCGVACTKTEGCNK